MHFFLRLLLVFTPTLLFSQTFTGTGAPIPDDGTTIVFDIPVSGLPAALNNQNFGLEQVCINLTHTWDADLSIALRTPGGAVISLISGIGGDTDGFSNTCLNGNAGTSIFQAPYPFTGSFRPLGDMGTLNNGQNPNGIWQLVILDTYAYADEGELFDWSITFGSQPAKPFAFESSDLPIVRILTNGQTIVNEPKIDAQMLVIDNPPGIRNYANQSAVAYSGPIGVELHGNSTQGFPKKSLRIETRDTAGADLDVALMGLPATSDFVLNANFSDKTLMRNALTYELSRRLGHYASRTRFCEVFIDDSYQGVYLLTEKIKRGKKRLDIAKLEETDVAGEDLTGGYILKVDWNTSPGWNSQFQQPNSQNYTYFQHEYPKWDQLAPVQSAYIQDYVDSFEVALASADFQENTTGWRNFGDETSFLDFLFINEMAKNVDGYRLSTYFHKDRGSKINMGPVWDFDLAWHNADYCDNQLSSGWAYDINYVCQDAGVPFWWDRLMEDSLFTQNMACRWQSLRSTTLRRDSIFAAIDSMAARVNEAQGRNFNYWPTLGIYVWPNPAPIPDSYAGEVQKMKNWITERLAWLDFSFGAYETVLNATFIAIPIDALQWQFSPAQTGNYTYTWDFGDGTSATGNAPLHQFANTGTYHVTMTVTTPYGCGSTSTQIIHIVNTGTTNNLAAGFQMYPNPVSGILNLTLPTDFGAAGTLILTNTLGETALTQSLQSIDQQTVKVNTSGLTPGLYRVDVRGEHTVHTGWVSVVRP